MKAISPEEGPLVLNLHSILRERLPKKINRITPGFVITGLEKLIRQDELNEILRVAYPLRGHKFAEKVLRHLDITIEVKGLDNLVPEEKYMFASNHPLGGLDGIALIAVLGELYGDDGIRYIVNDMLMNVEPLKDLFLPVNKFGAQGRASAEIINSTLKSGIQVLQFPAGLVSRRQKNGIIADQEWQKAFVAKAIEYERDIVPVKFEGRNTKFFYNLAHWRKKTGIKVNIEQAFLPSEVCKAKGNKYKIIIGKPIKWEYLKATGNHPKAIAANIREQVYAMK